jgi:hypothetical protein
MIGNAQGGCFAIAMTLAGVEARRLRKGPVAPVDPFSGVTTAQIDQTVLSHAKARAMRIEPLHAAEKQLGFTLRAVGAGRTLVYETERWHESAIDLTHVQAADENRRKVHADLAVIVSVGKPDEQAIAYVQTHPVQLFDRKELKQAVVPKKPKAEKKPKKKSEDEIQHVPLPPA